MVILLSLLAQASPDDDIYVQVQAASTADATDLEKAAACKATDDWSQWEACTTVSLEDLAYVSCTTMIDFVVASCPSRKEKALAIKARIIAQDPDPGLVKLLGTSGETEDVITDWWPDANAGELDATLAEMEPIGWPTEDRSVGSVGPSTAEEEGNFEASDPSGPEPRMALTPSEMPTEVERVLRRNTTQLRYCHEQAIRDAPMLHGELTVWFTVSENGRTSDVRAEGVAPLESCVVNTVRRWRFPDSPGTYEQTFVFPEPDSATR